ncbi:DUF6406 domain-containing protein [Nonomuraea sp. NPDC050556]|uniref:DUF6406 domain-containing protein n=1 Tax=Nonomuraea sp. NPDC050556 TaxID=3364369 RepID=UPI00378CA017
MRLRRGMPHWLDNATRERGLAVMSFEDGGKAVVAQLSRDGNTAHTVAVGDSFEADGVTWRVTEVADGDSVTLEEVR